VADASDAAHRIFASAAAALFLTDSDGRVTAWSPGAERIFLRRAPEVLGGPAAAIAGGAWADRLPELAAAVLAGGASGREEMGAVRGDGTEIQVDLSLSAVRDGTGSVTALVGVAQENSERRRLEEDLRSREGRLVEVARMTTAGEILAGLAHDVIQPLTSIGNFAAASQNHLKLPEPDVERVRSHLGDIVRQTGVAAEIVRRAKRFVHRPVEPTAFDLGELAREAVALLRSEETSRRVSVRVDAPAPLAVTGVRPHVEQVIVNLLRNAYESFAPDSRERRVVVRVAGEGAEAVLSVEDNGTGIGDEQARLEGTLRSAKEHGLGLGLAICRTIVERHHGRFSVARAAGGGTIARFTLPLSARSGDA
jgi:PAS domain S-box-containing protein